MPDFEPIASAQFVEDGTVADLKMENGRVYRCAWVRRGRCTAWWPLTGPRRSAIGLYDPVAWRRVENAAAVPSFRIRRES